MTSTTRSPTLTSGVRHVCRRHPVALAYLFGSQARGDADHESDLDIAVLPDPAVLREDRATLRFRLARSLAERLGLPLEMIDVVSLPDAPTLLQYNVIRRGRPLYARDPAAR